MNPLTNVKNITKLNEIELSKGTTDKKSWHDIYKDSAWIFIGGLAYGLTEGDVLAVFSQYGEIVNINLVRDKKTGKTKGFCFLCYANQKSTVLAVDNLNGIKLLNRTIRVDHVSNYKPPKDNEHDDEVTKQLKSEGCAPKPLKQESLPVPVVSSKKKKSKKEKKNNKKESRDNSLHKKSKIKKEKHDPGYDKYEFSQDTENQTNTAKKIRTSDSESSTSETSSDERFVNAGKETKNRGSDKEIDKTHNRGVASDFFENNERGEGSCSIQKRKLRDSGSDSDDNYIKRKRSIAPRNKDEKRVSSDVRYSKRQYNTRHDSDSSVPSSPSDDERMNVRKAPNRDQQKSSQSSASKSMHVSRDGRKEQRESSSVENTKLSKHYNQFKETYSMRPSRSEDSRGEEYDQSIHRNNRDRSDMRFNDDRRNIHDRSKNAAETSRLNYEQNNSRNYNDRNDHRNHDYEKDSKISYRDSSEYSSSARYTRSPSVEREEKQSKQRDRAKITEDWYDRRKK